jgi:hypothetical protein
VFSKRKPTSVWCKDRLDTSIFKTTLSEGEVKQFLQSPGGLRAAKHPEVLIEALYRHNEPMQKRARFEQYLREEADKLIFITDEKNSAHRKWVNDNIGKPPVEIVGGPEEQAWYDKNLEIAQITWS